MMEGCEDARDLQATQKNSEKTLFENPAQFISDLTRVTSRGSVRFGTLSHHSFFSRHNPHPHRVTHLSGLNGSPVCTVNDDWFSNTPLFPHPFIKSQVLDSGTRTHPLNYSSTSGAQSSRALLSDAWQEELKDLATKISLSAAGSGPGQRDKGQGSQEEEPSQRKTQYSSETGRIIPPSSCRNKHHSTATSHRRPATHRLQTDSLGGQELRVLELLCQILQTDSLSLVQQWLLLAGDREKEMVMSLLQQAMMDSTLTDHQQLPFTSETLISSTAQSRRKRRLKSLSSAQEALDETPGNVLMFVSVYSP
ncbi:protein TBATA [Hoplias malabaricus]|uniref:protein TBATA n=1 Tax=Hoplias malabaricus TaxID=27720 RepID=UPI00346340C0